MCYDIKQHNANERSSYRFDHEEFFGWLIYGTSSVKESIIIRGQNPIFSGEINGMNIPLICAGEAQSVIVSLHLLVIDKHMDNRREFIKKAATLSGAAGLFSAIPPSIQRALSINPVPGSTYLDAEHIVVLMQENRSFDHCYGSLQGVRGFNDPRAMLQQNKNRVWLQKNAAGETYVPFRLNIKDTNATHLGSLPHSWPDQVDARNGGKYDRWLISKASHYKGMENAPLSLGFYNRQDIPFYYALADAFTICDQNFSSSLTGTTPNRLFLWTGTIREKQNADSIARVSNSDVDYNKEANWTTFPERLEDNGISWKVYQNEISLESGLDDDEDSWLSNFTDNPLEWFSRYNVRFSPTHVAYLERMEKILPGEIKQLKEQLQMMTAETDEKKKLRDKIKSKQALLARATEWRKWTKENFEKLSASEKNLHAKAFATNYKDEHYRELDTLAYSDDDIKREMKVPKGDVLHQLREDVDKGQLPTVSWVIGSANFSDHPGSPWYGAWYVSEVLDILTKKPEVWEKTIFILCYDENDGYFDHVPPFVAPQPGKPETGSVSKSVDVATEFVTMEQDLKRTDKKYARESSIGLGYRVPLVIASPWSRGGMVCSQVFDHTSVLQFMETFLSHKTGKAISETNISSWRRAVCGDLTAVFKPYKGERIKLPSFPEKNTFYESIHSAAFKKNPTGFKALDDADILTLNENPFSSPYMPQQEKGIRTACPVPYQLYADGKIAADKRSFHVLFSAASEIFGSKTAGSPFNLYAYLNGDLQVRNYTVAPGDELADNLQLPIAGDYHFIVNGPNGFFRELKGNANDPIVEVRCEYARKKNNAPQLTGNINIILRNLDKERSHIFSLEDKSYGKGNRTKLVGPGQELKMELVLGKSFSWYDVSVKVKGFNSFEKRYAGHVETGAYGFTDPAMGRV
jgi:phospholipase C